MERITMSLDSALAEQFDNFIAKHGYTNQGACNHSHPGLNLTRFVSSNFAWMTMVAGTLIGVCLAIMILRILWEMWGPKPKLA